MAGGLFYHFRKQAALYVWPVLAGTVIFIDWNHTRQWKANGRVPRAIRSHGHFHHQLLRQEGHLGAETRGGLHPRHHVLRTLLGQGRYGEGRDDERPQSTLRGQDRGPPQALGPLEVLEVRRFLALPR
ncbi:hypothetical protein L596_028272 [Steinernema carpocapsae]|uniref:Uncharacterized protein n=1 Tax=Steinernema carpocapsae TaxID=34508 RepID=A0A4U5LY09_STECR|nr:hypothetical protein L596_028272 [Steinernema carpocapsae]